MRSTWFILLVSLFTTGEIVSQSKHPPNIVIIMSDDQGWGDLSVSGNINLSTPNIDRLAQEGATLENFFVSPVCSPTRAEILTGRYHVRCGVYGTSAGSERLDLDETTLADVLQQHGYRTGAYGKWHNGMQYPYHPNGRGFEEFYGFCSGHWGDYFSPMLEYNGQIIKGDGFVIDDFTSQAMSFIDQHRDEPFFVYLPYNTPHRPMQVPDRWWDKFEGKELVMRHRDPDLEDVQLTRAALAMCENIDWNVGRLVNKLNELQLMEETIIIYLSDNGPNGDRWNGDMKGKKGSTDEGGVRSPTFIQWKGHIEPGTVIPQIAGGIDFLPTLLDLADISYQSAKPLDGRSLEPLLLEKDVNWTERNLFSYWSSRTSVRSQNYRLDHEGQLFDMAADHGQKNDVTDRFPEIYQKLSQAKLHWEADVLSELPSNDVRPFPVGHPGYKFTQLPARDGVAKGGIVRSNRWPNCSYYTNWKEESDVIYWDVEVLAEGEFKIIIYYTCRAKDVGSTFEITSGSSRLEGKINEAFDPPLRGMENDRHERGNSYVKDWKTMNVGTVFLEPGIQTISISATDIPGEQAMDFRLMMINRVD